MEDKVNWKGWYIALVLTLLVLIGLFYWMSAHYA